MRNQYLCFITIVMTLFSCKKDMAYLKTDQSISGPTNFSVAVTDCGQTRIQTPGGWGANPRGNNPGFYLHANFSNAFSNGLVIGCEGGNTLKVTSAQAITNLLPTGGKATTLSGHLVNPTGIKNVLVGHLIALSLSVGFDNYDLHFGASEVHLADMIIGKGIFSGTTVGQFLNIANEVMGGCSSVYTIQEILSTTSNINESFVDGSRSTSFLICPETTPR